MSEKTFHINSYPCESQDGRTVSLDAAVSYVQRQEMYASSAQMELERALQRLTQRALRHTVARQIAARVTSQPHMLNQAVMPLIQPGIDAVGCELLEVRVRRSADCQQVDDPALLRLWTILDQLIIR